MEEQQPSRRRHACYICMPAVKKAKACLGLLARAERGFAVRKEGEGIRSRAGREGESDASKVCVQVEDVLGESGVEADHRVIDAVLKTYRSNSYARSRMVCQDDSLIEVRLF